MNNKTKQIVLIGLFSATAFILTILGNILPLSIAGFLKYDPKDIIVAISGFILGPLTALVVSITTALLELVTISTTGFYGLLMNIISTASFACISSGIYKKHRTIKGAIVGLITATLVTTGLMLLWNYFITPFYMGVPREQVAKMLPTVFLPFNLIKYGINASIAILIYKPITRALRKSKIIEGKPTLGTQSAPVRPNRLWISIIAIFVFVSLVFCLLILAKII